MQISEAARVSGVSAKMIRHYEAIGLVPPAGRRSSNYRDYSDDELHRLGFIRRARDLGFSIEAIRNLLKLWDDPARESAEVKRVAQQHLVALEEKIRALEEVRGTLAHLVDACDGDHRPHCPIIENLEGAGHHRH